MQKNPSSFSIILVGGLMPDTTVTGGDLQFRRPPACRRPAGRIGIAAVFLAEAATPFCTAVLFKIRRHCGEFRAPA